MKQLTWFECSAMLKDGDRVRFVTEWDMFPHCQIPEGTVATVVENDLNELNSLLWVLPDDRNVRRALKEWDGEIGLGSNLDAGADDPKTDREWQSLSPLAKE